MGFPIPLKMGSEFIVSVVVSILTGTLVLVFVALSKWKRELTQDVDSPNRTEEHCTRPPSPSNEKHQLCKDREKLSTFAHPLLASSLKGHSGRVTCLDFSSNGKYLASCCDDGVIKIWSTKDFLDNEHRCLCVSVELDYAALVRFSPDSRAIIAWLANGKTIRVFKMTKKHNGSLSFEAVQQDFPKRHKADVINIGIAETGRFIMTASSDATILIWDLTGEVLSSIDTNQAINSYATVSPCGRFVASCGFEPDVKVWEVCFDQDGNFTEVVQAFDLSGHCAGVQCFAFSNDSRRMATLSKDGTWKLWDINVEHKKQQDPHLLRTGEYPACEGSCIALSPDARVVAMSSGCTVTMWSSDSGELEEDFHHVHREDITDVRFDINGRFLVCSGDCTIHVFHNTPGYRAAIRDMEAMLKKTSDGTIQQRLRQQVQDAQCALDCVTSMSKD